MSSVENLITPVNDGKLVAISECLTLSTLKMLS